MFYNFLWNLWCVGTVVGIWPRFIEPKIIQTTKLSLPVEGLSKNLKVVQFSDLHLNACTSDRFLKKLSRKINALSPDVLLFTGDFICCSKLDSRLESFLNSLQARSGCYAIFGNHDYAQFVSVNNEGYYDIIEKKTAPIVKGFNRLFSSKTLKGSCTESAKSIPTHQELEQLLKRTPFTLLNNQTIQLAGMNITGVGELMLGRCLPELAFQRFDSRLPGIVLAHNPDCIPLLKNYPGQVVLCGHTHGGQINLPFIRDKFILTENKKYNRGLNRADDKWVYTSRGIGGVMHFRWFCPPELVELTLEKA